MSIGANSNGKDFMSDALWDDRRFRTFNVVDEIESVFVINPQ